MSHLTRRSIEILIPSELGYEKIPIVAVATVARRMGFSTDRIESLKMAMGEAVTNAIEHGNQFKAETTVLVRFSIEGGLLSMTVTDQGQQPIPNIPDKREKREDNRGWGMLLIRDLVDEVEVMATPGRNEIMMLAYLKK